MKITNFSELEAYLQKHSPKRIERKGAYKLDRMTKLMPLLGSPQEKLKVIHVAGTSGKTSTCYYISALLQASGVKVGLSVSPHVFSIAERAQINSLQLSEEVFCERFNEFISIKGVTDIGLTYFETLVGFAFWLFAREGCQYAVVEVGLGGLLDGTNVIENPDKAAVITDIGLDHTHILGNDLQSIAVQKAGIIKSHNQVFMMDQPEPVDKVIENTCINNHAILLRYNQTQLERDITFISYMPLFQKRNWLLASKVHEFLRLRDNLPELSAESTLVTQKMTIPARMQQLNINGKIVVLDGAHNAQKLEALRASMSAAFAGKTVAILASTSLSKQNAILESMTEMAKLSTKIILTSYSDKQDNLQRSINLEVLSRASKKAGFKKIDIEANAKKAFDKLLNQTEDVLLVTGSFYLINALQLSLKEHL